jgi:hypothetical protein
MKFQSYRSREVCVQSSSDSEESIYDTLALWRPADVGADRQFDDRAGDRPRLANKRTGVPHLIVFVVEQNTPIRQLLSVSHTLIHLRPPCHVTQSSRYLNAKHSYSPRVEPRNPISTQRSSLSSWQVVLRQVNCWRWLTVFCDVAPCSLVEIYRRFRGHDPDDGGSKHLWNVDKLIPDYRALQPRRQPSS